MNHENEIVNVRIDEIIPNRFQPRLAFDEKELNELADSIKMHGIIQPLVLRRIGDKYEIIAGERRYKASVLAGLTQVPAVIMNIDDQKSAEVAVVENLQRKDLTAIEEAQSYKKILDMGYLTQEELATRMGVAQSTIANKLRLLNLTIPVKEALLHNKISERHARSLLNITDNNLQISMLNRIIAERLTVRQTDEEINKLLGKTPKTDNTPKVTLPIVETKEDKPVENIIPNQIDIEQEKKGSKDIIEEYKPKDIDALLAPQSETTINETKPKEEKQTFNAEPKLINPFQEVDTEPVIMDFDVSNQTFENPVKDTPIETKDSSIIEEYRNQEETPKVQATPTSTKSISKAINQAREEARKIEEMGFDVDTEEFDFEDMYQIIIKIKKD
ncbi:nucleoid occlusion protein [Clostridium sp. CAG:628]|jgi:ParB family chromosome partitioning protein|nr:nucleoid occlusion protein [Clostridium sp. CAG:628]